MCVCERERERERVDNEKYKERYRTITRIYWLYKRMRSRQKEGSESYTSLVGEDSRIT